MNKWLPLQLLVLVSLFVLVVACDDDGNEEVAYVTIHNDFDNPEMDYNPPWTMCQVNYMGVDFGHVDIGEQSSELEVVPGLDNVLMVLA